MDSPAFELKNNEIILNKSANLVYHFDDSLENIWSKIILKDNVVLKLVLVISDVKKLHCDMQFELNKFTDLQVGCVAQNTKKLCLNVDFLLVGEHSKSDYRLGFIGLSDDKFDLKTTQTHIVSNSMSNVVCKSVLDDNATLQFDGTICIDKDIKICTSKQGCSNLLLSKTAMAKGGPSLKVYAKDVNCSHSFVCSGLNNFDIFYMKSRGINFKKTVKLLSNGFVLSVFEDFDDVVFNEISNCIVAF